MPVSKQQAQEFAKQRHDEFIQKAIQEELYRNRSYQNCVDAIDRYLEKGVLEFALERIGGEDDASIYDDDVVKRLVETYESSDLGWDVKTVDGKGGLSGEQPNVRFTFT